MRRGAMRRGAAPSQVFERAKHTLSLAAKSLDGTRATKGDAILACPSPLFEAAVLALLP